MKPSEQAFGDEGRGFTPAAKKRARELLALSLAGGLQAQNNPVRVEVTGDDHDVLEFRWGPMNEGISSELIEGFQTADANFWNALRMFSFQSVVFVGDGYRRALDRQQFLQYSRNYEDYQAKFGEALKSMQAAAVGEAAR